jgi:hypothetical protein
MARETTTKADQSQLDRFKEAARAAECDEDDARWEARLKRVVKHKPVPEKPE